MGELRSSFISRLFRDGEVKTKETVKWVERLSSGVVGWKAMLVLVMRHSV